MAGRGDTEAWYWQDDSFKLDLESPLAAAATSRSFWDDLTQSEGDSHALFASSPVTNSRYCNPSLFSLDIQSFCGASGSDSQSSPPSDFGVQQSDQYKRRRMLQFSATDTLPPDSATSVLASGLEDSINPSIPGSENHIEPFLTSPSPLSCTRNEDASGPAIANAQEWGEKWMVRCCEQNMYNACHLQETTNFHKTAPLPDISEIKFLGLPFGEFHTGGCPQLWQPQPEHQQEADMLQGPVTPYSKPPPFGQKASTGPSRFKLKSKTPVTYPFALLKPYSAEGAVTLNDINKRLLSLPPRPVQGTIPIKKERPATQSGSHVSGKSVVACTKIHTEGNGTITIMRTKG